MFDRFLEAQNPIYDRALKELRNGHKETHWMWFIFPPLKGLGTNPMSLHYAIKDENQTKEYWDPPILGERLRECFALIENSGKTPEQIFSPIYAMKYRSCKTLFGHFYTVK